MAIITTKMPFLKATGRLIQSTRRMGFINPMTRDPYWVERIGYREMVCYGFNGLPVYADRYDFPFPAIRYKEITGELQGIFEKQKGDWHLLSKEEKKELYRANFCQTFAEFQAPSGNWMKDLGYALMYCCIGAWMWIFLQFTVYDPYPDSFKPSSVRAQTRRMIDIQADPITGMCSNWDYEKEDWKVKTWWTPPNPFIKCPDDD